MMKLTNLDEVDNLRLNNDVFKLNDSVLGNK